MHPALTIVGTQNFSIIAPIAHHLSNARICIDIPCTYTKRLLLSAVARRALLKGLIRIYDSTLASVLWADYEDLDWDCILRGTVRANGYLVRKGLSRKAQLAYYIRKYVAKKPYSCLRKAVPETMVIETWDAFASTVSFAVLGASFGSSLGISYKERLAWCLREIEERMLTDTKVWILKPSLTNGGEGVKVVVRFEQVLDNIETWPDCREWVLQTYIQNPLLYQGRKFHLRAYVLAVGDLAVYVYQRILLLCSMVSYVAHDIESHLAHITNTRQQSEDPHFDEHICIHLLDDLVDDLGCSPLRLTHEDAAATAQAIIGGIREVSGELFRALHDERTVFCPQPNCFELYGLDFLVSRSPVQPQAGRGQASLQSVQVHLLEVNPGPDLAQVGERLQEVAEGLLESVLDLAVLGVRAAKDMQLVYEDIRGCYDAQAKASEGGIRLLDDISL